jgi:hypothetical protein
LEDVVMDGNNGIDVEKILSDIKKEIKDKNLANDIPHFEMYLSSMPSQYTKETSDMPEKPIHDEAAIDEAWDGVEWLMKNSRVFATRTITSHRKVLGRIIVGCKRVIRKLNSFFIEPIVEDQNSYNTQVTQVLHTLCVALKAQMKEINALRDYIKRSEMK